MLVYFALDISTAITHTMLFDSMLCHCIIDTDLFIEITAFHNVQRSLNNWFSQFYAQTVFVYENYVLSGLIALKNNNKNRTITSLTEKRKSVID